MSSNYFDALSQMMTKAGLTPGTRGQGFADVPYWSDLANSAGFGYVQNRLGADLAGTGPDKSTGTPQSGVWDQSGSGSGGGTPPSSNTANPNSGSQNLFSQPTALSALAGFNNAPQAGNVSGTGYGKTPWNMSADPWSQFMTQMASIFQNPGQSQ